MVREAFSEEQRYHEVEERAMQLSGSITLCAEQPEMQRPCGEMCLEIFELQQEAKRVEPVNNQEKGRVGPGRSPGTRPQRALLAQVRPFHCYSKWVGNHWKVLSEGFCLFTFASVCHPRSSD